MLDEVKEYYGKILQRSADLKTNACCVDMSLPVHLKNALTRVHDDVLARFYGCGLIMPEHLAGARILDLGSGSGRDCYVLSQFVGEQGEVVGVDMTEEQLAVARNYIDYHQAAFGFAQSNVKFLTGYIERLNELPLDANSFDIVVSNCVINLSPDKAAVLKQAYQLLKPGGELYFSDVYADRRIPKALADDPVLYGECLSGALYWNDFENLAKQAGFLDPRLVEDRPISVDNDELLQRVGHINFFSATYRLFKLDKLEPACEDYGQAVIYKGGIPYHEEMFSLDKHHAIYKGKVFPVCGNTYRMLNETRFKPFFGFIGNWDSHYGIFEGCGTGLPFDLNSSALGTGSSCC